MPDQPQHRATREPLAHRLPLSALADTWARLGAPPIVDLPGPGVLAGIARANLPILIGRTLIRAEKTAGKWHVSKDDLQTAALDLAALAEPAGTASSTVTTVTVQAEDPHWRGKLARMLRDTHQQIPAWTGPEWKKHWYWACQWGCLNFSQVARGEGDTWTIPTGYAEFAAAAAAQIEQATIDRKRCTRCGQTAQRRRGWADVDTPGGWENLCADCLASHDSQLRDYQGQLRDIPYARARYRRENPPTWYRCILCGQPAVVWDHCHEHGYTRGPLCRQCNTNDHWLFRSPYRLDRLPIDHVEQCKGCTGAGPGTGVVAAIIQFWIAGLATMPEEHLHPHEVRLTAFPSRQIIQDAVKAHTYTVEPITWACRQCEETWQQQIDPELMLGVSSRVVAYLRTGDLSLIAADKRAQL
jgi:Recombination endonuclease VII